MDVYGSGLYGAGLYGVGGETETVWTVTVFDGGPWNSTYLHDIRILGGMGPIGAGSPGGTVWTATRLAGETTWQNTL